jgi:hypothetical protein
MESEKGKGENKTRKYQFLNQIDRLLANCDSSLALPLLLLTPAFAQNSCIYYQPNSFLFWGRLRNRDVLIGV